MSSLIQWFNGNPHGYGGPGTQAPSLADDSDDSDTGLRMEWDHTAMGVVVGSETGLGTPLSSSCMPMAGGPFSALIHSMWPQDILCQIQQTEDSGNHPECEYDEFGFRMEHGDIMDTEDPDPQSFATTEDPSLRLRWTAHMEFTQSHIAGDLTWDKVSQMLPRSEKLRDLVYAGIPHSMRTHVWVRLSGALQKKSASELSYKRILKKSSKQALPAERQIDKDLCRTLPTNACFHNTDSIGIPKLRRILCALAWLYPDIGYCQGMGLIVSSLLLLLEEEDVFWVMVAIIEDLIPSSYYSSTLIGVQADQRVLRQLIANYLPDLDMLLKDHDIELSLITLHWFLTLMSSVLSMKVLLRVWDVFFYEGSISLFRMTLGMLKMKEGKLITLENSAQIFNCLSDLPGEVTDVDVLFKHANRASSSLTNVILETHRKKHMAVLYNDLKNYSNDNQSSLSSGQQHVSRRSESASKGNWVTNVVGLGYSVWLTTLCASSLRGRSNIALVKAKNIRQTETIADLRAAVMMIARHFNRGGKRKDLKVDYSIESHAKDYDNYVNVARNRHRRAKALLDFERHEDDELGFRKNDIVTIISQKDEHCWIGELNGLRGWFPAKFVEILDERSKEYDSAGDDSVSEAVTDLVRGHLCTSLRTIFEHGLRRSALLGGPCHPWVFLEEASRHEVEKDYESVYSRLVLCKTYRLDEDGKVLSPEELLYRAIQAINASHDAAKSSMDIKLRSLICYGLNEQVLHLWFEVLCSSEATVARWYHPYSFLRSPCWIQIKCELRVLAQFAFSLSIKYELGELHDSPSAMKEDVQDMLVKHHLFSWDI